jgi:hypothetical protein
MILMLEPRFINRARQTLPKPGHSLRPKTTAPQTGNKTGEIRSNPLPQVKALGMSRLCALKARITDGEP